MRMSVTQQSSVFFFAKLLNRLAGEEGNEGKEPEKEVQSYRILTYHVYILSRTSVLFL